MGRGRCRRSCRQTAGDFHRRRPCDPSCQRRQRRMRGRSRPRAERQPIRRGGARPLPRRRAAPADADVLQLAGDLWRHARHAASGPDRRQRPPDPAEQLRGAEADAGDLLCRPGAARPDLVTLGTSDDGQCAARQAERRRKQLPVGHDPRAASGGAGECSGQHRPSGRAEFARGRRERAHARDGGR